MKTDVEKCNGYFHPSMKVVTLRTRFVLCLSGENTESYVLGSEEGLWDDDPINE